MAVKLGDLLLKAKLISQDQLDVALKSQREEGGKLGEALVRTGAVNESQITETLSQQFGVPSIDLASFWQNGYPELRKELRRRYPKHAWPDDPLATEATRSGLKRDMR